MNTGESKLKPRRLKGHTAAATCCVASSSRPGLVASSGEDGCICWFDLRCKDVVSVIDVSKGPISSLCFKTGNEDLIYASAGTEILCFDLSLGSHAKPVETYNYSRDEINQITYSSKSGFLASADDTGDVKIIDTRQKCMYKSLRAAHASICSSVQFIPWKPWSAITGGLDSKLAMWDFSKGRQLFVIDYGAPENNTGQSFNPPFVHSIAIPENENILGGIYKVCAVARGDGVIDIINLQSDSRSKSKKSGGQSANNQENGESNGKRVHLDYTLGGHTSCVSCVSFSVFGEKGKFLISGGNDSSIKVWDWSNQFSSVQSNSSRDVVSNINVNKKVNWICTTPTDSENLIVCDTSKVLKVYSI